MPCARSPAPGGTPRRRRSAGAGLAGFRRRRLALRARASDAGLTRPRAAARMRSAARRGRCRAPDRPRRRWRPRTSAPGCSRRRRPQRRGESRRAERLGQHHAGAGLHDVLADSRRRAVVTTGRPFAIASRITVPVTSAREPGGPAGRPPPSPRPERQSSSEAQPADAAGRRRALPASCAHRRAGHGLAGSRPLTISRRAPGTRPAAPSARSRPLVFGCSPIHSQTGASSRQIERCTGGGSSRGGRRAASPPNVDGRWQQRQPLRRRGR